MKKLKKCEEEQFQFQIIGDDMGVPPSVFEQEYIELLEQRKLFLNGEINDIVANEICLKIIKFNREDKDVKIEERKPITLFINSNGGSVTSGLQIIDIINMSKTPIVTINKECALSMASAILVSGHKRYSFPSATTLVHDGDLGLNNSTEKTYDAIKYVTKLNDKTKEIIVSKTKISDKLYNKQKRVEWYILSDEAKELGIVDGIVGVDVELEEII